MGDLLAVGASWQAGKLKSGVSRLVRITRGSETIEVPATLGETEFQIDEDGGVRIAHSDRTFLITATDYVFGGQVVAPQTGDLITDTVEAPSGESTFQALHPAGGSEQPYKYDRYGVQLSIYMKRTATDPALA
jgi:hypothetical protein